MPITRTNNDQHHQKRKAGGNSNHQARKKTRTKSQGKKKQAPQQHIPPSDAFSDATSSNDENTEDDMTVDANMRTVPPSLPQPRNYEARCSTEVVTGKSYSSVPTTALNAYRDRQSPDREFMPQTKRNEKGYKDQMVEAGYFQNDGF